MSEGIRPLPDRRKIIEQLFARLSAREFGALEELLCDDAVFDVAYAPAGAAFTVKGATAIQAMFETGVATVFSRLDFEVLATYLGQESRRHRGGVRQFRRRGAHRTAVLESLCRHIHGPRWKVARWREYHNPERMIEAFGNPSGSS